MTWPPVAPSSLDGRYVTLRRLVPDDAPALLDSADNSVWRYLSYGSWPSADEYAAWIAANAGGDDPLFFAVVVEGEPRGIVSYLRTDEANGVTEIGHIWYAPSIQRSRATTEATYLLARHVFDDLGYRRLEWKCNALNERSRRAAERFGFTYEGTFRQHMWVKGENRDTAWYSMLDGEWPGIRDSFERWLDPANFDESGRQRTALQTPT